MAQAQKPPESAPRGRVANKDGETLRILRAALDRLENATRVPDAIKSSPMTAGIIRAAEERADGEGAPERCPTYPGIRGDEGFAKAGFQRDRIMVAISQHTENRNTEGMITEAVLAACDLAAYEDDVAGEIVSALLEGAEWTAGADRCKAFALVLDAVSDILVLRNKPASSLVGLLDESVSSRLWCMSAERILLSSDMAGDKENMLLELLVAKGDMDQILGIQEKADSQEVRDMVSALIDSWECEAAAWASCLGAMDSADAQPAILPSAGLQAIAPATPDACMAASDVQEGACSPEDEGILPLLKSVLSGKIPLAFWRTRDPRT